MDDEGTLFHDHSTPEGRLFLFLHRLKWKYLIPPAVFLAAFAGIAILIASVQKDLNKNSNVVQLAPGNSMLAGDDPALQTSQESAGWTVVTQPGPGIIQAEGCENGLYAFEGFDETVPISSAKHLRISYLVIDAPALTLALREWTSLETIVIENVWVNGNFSRAYLPHLKKFIYHQYRNGKTDQYKQPETLKQTLFFDKNSTGTWDIHRDLLNLNMSIQVSVEGTKILNIEPDDGEININTHDCENILKNYDPLRSFQVSTLSMSWCPITPTVIEKLKENGAHLKYLFLNNAVPPTTEELGKVTSSLKNLKELHIFQRFHCDWPGYEIYLNVSDLSPELETLSLTNLDLMSDGISGANSVRNLSLDHYIGENVVNNFTFIFPNLKSLALFNITAERSYPILKKVLIPKNESKLEFVIVTNLTRIAKEEVESVLGNAGVPPNASSFKLELQKDGVTYVGRELTNFEINFYRFTRLAFKKIDTYADYVTWDADPK